CRRAQCALAAGAPPASGYLRGQVVAMKRLIDFSIGHWNRPTLSASLAAVHSVALTAAGPSTAVRLTHTFSTLPPLRISFGARVAVTVSGVPSISTTQVAVCGGIHSL